MDLRVRLDGFMRRRFVSVTDLDAMPVQPGPDRFVGHARDGRALPEGETVFDIVINKPRSTGARVRRQTRESCVVPSRATCRSVPRILRSKRTTNCTCRISRPTRAITTPLATVQEPSRPSSPAMTPTIAS